MNRLRYFLYTSAVMAILSLSGYADGDSTNELRTKFDSEASGWGTTIIELFSTKLCPLMGIYIIFSSWRAYQKGDQEGQGMGKFMGQIALAVIISGGPYLIMNVFFQAATVG